MPMSPENYVRLEKRSIELLKSIKEVIDDISKGENPEAELRAISVYDEIVALETELNIAIKNLKHNDKIKKYQQCLEDISSYKYHIHMIAHIM